MVWTIFVVILQKKIHSNVRLTRNIRTCDQTDQFLFREKSDVGHGAVNAVGGLIRSII